MTSDRNPTAGQFNAKRLVFAVLTALLFCAFSYQLWFHAVRTSATFDEPAHTVAGYQHWRCGDFGINPEHPPLVKLLATVPFNFRTMAGPQTDCGTRLVPKSEMFGLGGNFLVENNIDSVLIPARLLAALLSLALAALIFFAAREMFGSWAAVTALAILAFEPTLIAHGALVTTDMGLSVTAFGTFYALYRYVKVPNWRRFVIVAVAMGLMLAAKHSAVIFVPVLFVLFIVDALIYREPLANLSKLILRRVGTFAGAFLIAFVILWAFYGFRYTATPNLPGNMPSVGEYIMANGRPEMVESSAAKIVTAVSHARIFPESYILGLADIIASNSRNVWIFGERYVTGQWYYFPLAFAVKTSIALLFLLPFGLLMAFFARERRRELLFLLAPALAFFAVSLTSKMNIGVRHILPVYAFFIVAAAAGAVWMCTKARAFQYVVVALLLFHAVTTVMNAPNHIAFANLFFGGTDSSYLVFRDSNVDWGQNYKLVNEYLAGEGITDCWFAGFGNPEVMRASQPCRFLPDSAFQRSPSTMPDSVPPVIDGTVLISVSNLPPRGGPEYLALVEAKPTAQIGGTIFVYNGRFEMPVAAALNRIVRANFLASKKQFDEAIAEAHTGVELAPNDPRVHLGIGLILTQAGRKDDARREFETAIELARSEPTLFRNAEVRAKQELRNLDSE